MTAAIAAIEDVEVRERIVYDATQLSAFIGGELAGVGECTNDAVRSLGAEAVDELAGSLVGKIWSAGFHARKPRSAGR